MTSPTRRSVEQSINDLADDLGGEAGEGDETAITIRHYRVTDEDGSLDDAEHVRTAVQTTITE